MLSEDEPPKIGTRVYAIGNPQGLVNTLSEGLVSAVRKDGNQVSLIQTTAAISPGSSGGPLLGPDGRVIGVTTAYLSGGQNLNFAVSASRISLLLGDEGELVPLASAGVNPLDSHATSELDKVWEAIGEGDLRRAHSLLVKLRAELQANPLYWFVTGCLHDEMENHHRAVEAYAEAVRLKPDYATAYNNMGIALRKLGRDAEAIAAYRSAIGIKPDHTRAYYNMGIALNDLGRYAEAIAAYKSVIGIDPDDHEAYNNMGAALHRLGWYAEAIAAYKSVIRIKPDYTEAYINIGIALDDLGRYAEAIAAYKSVIRIKPDHAEAYNNMGIALRKLGRHAEAIAAYKSAIRIKPNHAGAYYNMGIALGKLGRYAEAIAAYKSAIRIKPKYAEAYYNMALALDDLRHYAEAISAYNSVIRMAPRTDLAEDAAHSIRIVQQTMRSRR